MMTSVLLPLLILVMLVVSAANIGGSTAAPVVLPTVESLLLFVLLGSFMIHRNDGGVSAVVLLPSITAFLLLVTPIE